MKTKNSQSAPIRIALLAATCLPLLNGSALGSFGTNLIVNPNAEADPAANPYLVNPVTGWSAVGNFTIGAYTTDPEFPTTTDPGPTDRGNNFFAGGPSNELSSAKQTIDISSLSLDVDLDIVTFELSGWFGGWRSQDD